jgi:diadenosine tetraphosphate (Ap4A) HIT family hydrolase
LSNCVKNKKRDDCFVCRKHSGETAPPPGGYIFEDTLWKVCHAPAESSALGTLILESKRHFLDYSEMNQKERGSFGGMLKIIYVALKQLIPAERIYTIAMMEGAAHFHVWLVPRIEGESVKGSALLNKEQSSSLKDVIQLTDHLRNRL